MDWTKVNWFPEEQTMDITQETVHHKPRWYVTYASCLRAATYGASYLVPVVFGILNHLLK